MSVSMFPFGQTVRDAVDDPPAFWACKNLKFSQFAGG
jgi:hypothetical protein